jgi:hypothetical protein
MNKKIAIVVLSKGYHHESMYESNLIRRNMYLEQILLSYNKDNYDFIIVHEGNIPNHHQHYISQYTPNLDIMFWDVKNIDPKNAFNDEKNVINRMCPPNQFTSNFFVGYKHMCHFWSIDFLEYFKDYKYIVRVDDDCFVDQFDLNLLDMMEKENILFTSPMFQGQDDPLVINGLEQFREKFAKENSIHIKTPFNEIKCPYTNFMIVDIESINKNSLIKSFLKEIDKCGCIYSNRWGDLPIWGMILDLFLDPLQYKELKEIKYYHGSHDVLINF